MRLRLGYFIFMKWFFHVSTDSLILISYTEVFPHPKPVPSFSAEEIKNSTMLHTIFSLI